MNDLIEKIAAYKRVTQKLIDKTKEYEEFVKANIPSEFWSKLDLKYFGNSSNGDYHIDIDGKLIPSNVIKLDSSFHWCNDFNFHYEFVSPEELISWCKELPALIKQANDYIHNLTLSAETVISEINI